MTRKPTPHELRDRRREVRRALKGAGPGRLGPFVPREVFIELFKDCPPIDYEEFRADIDRYVDQDPTPRF